MLEGTRRRTLYYRRKSKWSTIRWRSFEGYSCWNSSPKYSTVTEDLCFNSEFRGSCRDWLPEDGPSNDKRTYILEDNSLEILMWISYHKNPFSMHAVERVLDNWKAKKNVKYFLVICESKDPSIHCNSFSKLAVF